MGGCLPGVKRTHSCHARAQPCCSRQSTQASDRHAGRIQRHATLHTHRTPHTHTLRTHTSPLRSIEADIEVADVELEAEGEVEIDGGSWSCTLLAHNI